MWTGYSGTPTGLEPQRPIDYLLDPFIWWGGRG